MSNGRQVERIVAGARQRLIGQSDRAGRRLARILREVEEEILMLMAASGSERITRGRISSLMRRIDRVAQQARPEVATFLRSELSGAAITGLETQANLFATAWGVESLGRIPNQRVVSTFLQFERDVRARRILAIDDARLMQRWGDLYDSHMQATIRRIQGEFTTAAARGSTYKTLAQAVERPLGGLRIAGRMNSDAFALGFTRAKLTEVASNASVRVAQDAGFDRFRNYGISDTRQSNICRGATAAEPRSLAEWEGSEWGKPPRHVLNCRCYLGVAPGERQRLDVGEVMERVARRRELANA